MKINFLKQIPMLLIYSRLLMAIYYILAVIYKPFRHDYLICLVLVYAILSDIFDGIIARKLKCDTNELRQMDSRVDLIFWLSLLYLLVVVRFDFMRTHVVEFAVLVFSELFVQLYGYLKFKSPLALHTYSAKAWAVLLTITVLQLILVKQATLLFYITFLWGLLTQLEVCYIIYKLRTYTVDVKSVFKLGK
jgi:phosphatidylglycerophosphate synthase